MDMHSCLTSDTQSATTNGDDRNHFDCFPQIVLFFNFKLSDIVEVVLLKCQNKAQIEKFCNNSAAHCTSLTTLSNNKCCLISRN